VRRATGPFAARPSQQEDDLMQAPALTRGVHHVGLTVPDLALARRFFVQELGYEQRGELPDYPAVFVSDGKILISLWQVRDPSRAVPLDRAQNVGLHHLALQVEGHANLDALHRRLARLDDVEIEFAPELLGSGPTRHMMTRVAGGLRLEFIAVGA
jgi:catechol 2,3-dioxygenase-like lactoylglutathione lyase family enzyme